MTDSFVHTRWDAVNTAASSVGYCWPITRLPPFHHGKIIQLLCPIINYALIIQDYSQYKILNYVLTLSLQVRVHQEQQQHRSSQPWPLQQLVPLPAHCLPFKSSNSRMTPSLWPSARPSLRCAYCRLSAPVRLKVEEQ